MFKLDPHPTFPATVQITRPGRESLPLKVVFKHKKATELQAFLDGATGRTDTSILEEMVDSIDASEKDAAMSDADFLRSLADAYPAARSDLLHTYLRELTESRAKNS